MTTRKIVPRADDEGGIGTALKQWASGWIKALTVTTINALSLAAQAIGFTLTGGTAPKTLTVDETVAISDKAAKTHGALHLPNAADPIGLPKFSAHKNGTNQTGIIYTIPTKITFPTEEYDVGSTYDAANSRWIPGVIGIAHVSAALRWNTTVDQTLMVIRIYLNGDNYKQVLLYASGVADISSLISNDIPIIAVTDYIEIYGLQYSGIDLTILGAPTYTWFMGHMLP